MTAVEDNGPLSMTLPDSGFVDDRPDVADRWKDEGAVRDHHHVGNVVDLFTFLQLNENLYLLYC